MASTKAWSSPASLLTRTWAVPRVQGSSGEGDCLLSIAAESNGAKGRIEYLVAMKANADGKLPGRLVDVASQDFEAAAATRPSAGSPPASAQWSSSPVQWASPKKPEELGTRSALFMAANPEGPANSRMGSRCRVRSRTAPRDSVQRAQARPSAVCPHSCPVGPAGTGRQRLPGQTVTSTSW